jgi:uncharacterized tellurite resistance protein B-like protein
MRRILVEVAALIEQEKNLRKAIDISLNRRAELMDEMLALAESDGKCHERVGVHLAERVAVGIMPLLSMLVV